MDELSQCYNVPIHPLTAGMPRSEERFSRNAETDLVCRLLLEKKNAEPGPIGQPISWRVAADPASVRTSAVDRRALRTSGSGRADPASAAVLHHDPDFFFNDTPTTEIYTLSLHDALPILMDELSQCYNVPIHPLTAGMP